MDFETVDLLVLDWILKWDFQIGLGFEKSSGYRSATGLSFVKNFVFADCHVTLMHDDCTLDCTTLAGNVQNINPEYKPTN